MLSIDGSHGEGGGQIVRTALALSVLTQTPFEMTAIRSGRPQPGLKAQHLTAISALRQLCGAVSNDVAAGSQTLRFFPGPLRPGEYEIHIGTAGSISLLLQGLFLPLLFASGKTTLHLSGGTCGKWQAPVEYTQYVLLPYLQRFGMLDLHLEKRGYYPKGGGKVRLTIIPKFESWQNLPLDPFDLSEAGTLKQIEGISFAESLLRERQVAERQAKAAENRLKPLNVPVRIKTEYQPARNPGSGIVVWATFQPQAALPHPLILGADGLGEHSVTAEAVGETAARMLLREIHSTAPVDEHLSDQLIPFLALLPGSRMRVPRVSGHLLSNCYVVEQFLEVRFKVEGKVVSVG